MLKEWRLENFKAFGFLQEVELAGINVFAGANSGGKSTLLQSILLISQSFSNRFDNGSMQLNGIYTQLGSYSDIKNNLSEKKSITISFTLSNLNSGFSRFRFGGSGFSDAKFEFEFSDYFSETNPNISRLRCEIHGSSEKELQSVEFFSSTRNPEEYCEVLGLSRYSETPWLLNALRYEIRNYSLSQSIQEIGGIAIGVVFDGLKPNRIAVRIDRKKIVISLLNALILDGYVAYSHSNWLRYEKVKLDGRLINLIYKELDVSTSLALLKKRIINKLAARDFDFDIDLDTLYRRFSGLSSDSRGSVREDLGSVMHKIANIIEDFHMADQYDVESIELDHTLSSVFEAASDSLTRQVLYLGPLREPPKVVYPISAIKNSRDVGNKGENCAMIISINRDRIVQVPVPSANDDTTVVRRIPFHQALDLWMNYLEIAESIEIVNEKQLGYRIKVNRADSNADLTHVGVGVSQVLPILAMCLLSNRGETIILEQPELHLHPKIQSKLALLFSSMSNIGVQFIIETHSEYLINRFRIGIIREMFKEGIKIYFVRNSNGVSNIEKLKINDFGVISNWPTDFIDQTDKDLVDMAKFKIEKIKRNKESAQGN